MATVTLYTGDNLKILPTLAANSVDAVVTDPPYEVGLSEKVASWDIWPPCEVWIELARIVKDDGLLAFSLAPHVAHDRVPDVIQAGWNVLEVGFWVYGSGRPVNRDRLKRCYDLIYFMSQSTKQLHIEQARGAFQAGQITGRKGSIYGAKGPLGRQFGEAQERYYEFGRDYHPANVAGEIGSLAFGDSGYEMIFAVKRLLPIGRTNETHPTEKPLDLVAQMVKLVSKADDMVLDPWMGRGTTGEACIRLGRNFYGMDIVPAYVEATRSRLNGIQIEMFQNREE